MNKGALKCETVKFWLPAQLMEGIQMLDLDAIFDNDRVQYRTWNDLPGDWRCEFEERAAVREFDGMQAREHAEAEAFCEILERMRAAGLAV